MKAGSRTGASCRGVHLLDDLRRITLLRRAGLSRCGAMATQRWSSVTAADLLHRRAAVVPPPSVTHPSSHGSLYVPAPRGASRDPDRNLNHRLHEFNRAINSGLGMAIASTSGVSPRARSTLSTARLVVPASGRDWRDDGARFAAGRSVSTRCPSARFRRTAPTPT